MWILLLRLPSACELQMEGERQWQCLDFVLSSGVCFHDMGILKKQSGKGME